MSGMILGFTGTRRDLTTYQHAHLHAVIATLPRTFVHGGAIGADEEVHNFMVLCGLPENRVEIFPGRGDREVHWNRRSPAALVLAWDAPLRRNRAIVARADRLIAAPATVDEVLRSGTWATVRYARAAGKPVTILLPCPSPRSASGIVEG